MQDPGLAGRDAVNEAGPEVWRDESEVRLGNEYRILIWVYPK